ncbi:chromosome condensation protein CrcB [Cellulomonas sp. Root485]|jgi:CrcB protein|uniref:fluoride efflux transporter CrcB n=1 Tax=Cellulomonas sp. Root485 TaxID=1736546 RepID=UPI000700F43D|nr:fluoride efflux transporter CrcB [Cellulomonas sp. Root485]KQY22057.1 chromosome condensation protein CrcB [Cellulomonas sp. Root485]
MTVLLIAVLGGVGAAARFVVDGSVRARWTRVFPLATFVVNVTGSFLIGLLAGAHLYRGLGPTWLAVAATGFCGGYTTFSTAMVETVRLIQAGEVRRATANAVGSVLLCLGAAALGVAVMAL